MNEKDFQVSKLTKQDKKNMNTILRTVMNHRPETKLKCPINAPSKKEMEQKYLYNSETNTFVKSD